MKKPKYSIEIVKATPPELLLLMIEKAKRSLKSDITMQKICEKYNVDINEIDYIPVMFGDLDVSATTDHGVVILNYKLLCDGDFEKDYSYLIHEFSHVFQQTARSKPTKGADDGKYLNNKFEQEGFKNQVEYISNHQGEDKAEKYVDDLLAHHDIKDKEEKDKLEAIFLENI